MRQKRIRLRDGFGAVINLVTEQNAAEVIRYTNSVVGESDNLTFGVEDFNTTEDQMHSLIRQVSGGTGGVMLKARVTGNLASILLIRRTDRARIRHVGTLGMTVRRRYWGLGLGRAICEAALSEAHIRGINRIELRVRADNDRAIQLYETVGFIHEGRLQHSFYCDGNYHDELAMAALLDDFPSLPG